MSLETSSQEALSGNSQNQLVSDRNRDGVDRRGFLHDVLDSGRSRNSRPCTFWSPQVRAVLPETLRITGYKAWMPSVLVLWWLVVLLGFATYLRWYVAELFR